jgi:molybdopterin converting factor small subunit
MHVEFLGIPRQRARVSEVEIEARTLGQAFRVLSDQFPELRELISERGLHASVAANLNGDLFVTDPNTPLTAGDRVILLSSDAGG